MKVNSVNVELTTGEIIRIAGALEDLHEICIPELEDTQDNINSYHEIFDLAEKFRILADGANV